jgi:transposase
MCKGDPPDATSPVPTRMPLMMYLGIDIAKATFEAALQRADDKFRQTRGPTTATGHAQLIAWLQRHADGPVHACLEATGTYGEALATALVVAGHTVSLVNPAAVHAFAASQLRRAKTDRVDAQVLAHFAAAHRPPAWTPPPPELRELQELVRRIDALEQMLVQDRNRLASGGASATVRASITATIAHFEAAIDDLLTQVRAHFDQHPPLRAQRDLLTTIPGIGEKTAARVLAASRDPAQFRSARQYAAFSGLVPRPVESGTLRGKARLARIGSARLRHALYFPALTALRYNPVLQALQQRLTQKHKPKMVIVAAAMRKLLHLIYGVLTSKRPFDPTIAMHA